MAYKFTLSLDEEEVDELVVATLQEAYQECVYTLLDKEKQKYDPIEDVLRRQEGLAEVLNYYMIPKEFIEYMEFWNNYTQKDYDEANQTEGVPF